MTICGLKHTLTACKFSFICILPSVVVHQLVFHGKYIVEITWDPVKNKRWEIYWQGYVWKDMHEIVINVWISTYRVLFHRSRYAIKSSFHVLIFYCSRTPLPQKCKFTDHAMLDAFQTHFNLISYIFMTFHCCTLPYCYIYSFNVFMFNV
jgi:hypothetical protein